VKHLLQGLQGRF